MTAPRYIAVEGPIGAGKSSLARILATNLGARLVEEEPEKNPFLASFYRDSRRHALSAQLFFLLERYRQQSELLQTSLFERGGIVSDYLFAKDRLFATITLSSDELSLYDKIYQVLSPRVQAPDLVVYLQARPEVLLSRIEKRGRSEERNIRADYMREVIQAYSEYFFNYCESPLLIVESSEIDFIANEQDQAALMEMIHNTRTGINHWSRQ